MPPQYPVLIFFTYTTLFRSGYYSQSGINIKPGQKVIDVIREFGDYIPLKKGRQISAQQLLERFLFDRKKQYDYVEKLSGGRSEEHTSELQSRGHLVYRLLLE